MADEKVCLHPRMGAGVDLPGDRNRPAPITTAATTAGEIADRLGASPRIGADWGGSRALTSYGFLGGAPSRQNMTVIMTRLTSHQFEGRPVRTSLTDSGEPLFVAKDVCEVLDLDHSKTLERVPDWAKGGGVKYPTPGGETSPSEGEVSGQNRGGRGHLQTLTEAGVYWVALRSNKPNAEAFQKWVCTEVLPALRKHGVYRLAAPGLQRQIELLKLKLRAQELRAEAQTLEALARGFTEAVTEIPEGYAATADWAIARGLARDHKSQQSVLALLTSRLRGRAESKIQRVARAAGGRGYIKRRLWPIAALETAARDAGLLNLEG